MARLPTTQTYNLVAPPTNLPYKCHPIYHLRRLLIIIAAIGAVLCILCAGTPWDAPSYLACTFFLAVSIFFAFCDLTSYALKKVQNPDEEPKWPRVIFMIGDACLVVIHLMTFTGAIASLYSRGYSYDPRIWEAYAALTVFLSSALHAYAFWKEVMARYKNKWLARLILGPCPRCGYHEEAETPSSQQAQSPQPPNTQIYAGPSASFQRPTTHTPTSQDSAMEEGILIGSELKPNYGAAGYSDLFTGQPEEVVVAKGKKKRVVEASGESGDAEA